MEEVTGRDREFTARAPDRSPGERILERRRSPERRRCERRTARPDPIPEIAIVVPAYNEEAVIEKTVGRLEEVLDRLIESRKAAAQSRIWVVDDGSTDRTWEMIEGLAAKKARLRGIRLSRNRGHQNALLAGLLTVPGDALISIDADLQDDVSVIDEMVEGYRGGSDVVYGVRRNRRSDTRFKRLTAIAFYKLMRGLGVETVENHADYRLMSRKAVEALREFKEVNVFLRGVVPLIGFRSACVYYNRAPRPAGESKYPLGRMLALAWDAVTSFSVVPLRIVTALGSLVFLASLGVSAWVLWVRLVSQSALPGWASTVLPIALLGGIQLLGLGVIGEYLGKLYAEAKRRPRYVIEKIV